MIGIGKLLNRLQPTRNRFLPDSFPQGNDKKGRFMQVNRTNTLGRSFTFHNRHTAESLFDAVATRVVYLSLVPFSHSSLQVFTDRYLKLKRRLAKWHFHDSFLRDEGIAYHD